MFSGVDAVRAFDRSSGDLAWTRQIAPSTDYTLYRNRLFVGTEQGNVYALDARDGEERWSADVGYSAVEGVTVQDRTVYAHVGDSVLTALDVSDGQERWHYRASGSGVGHPTVIGDTIYFGTDSELAAINANDGSEQWTAEVGTTFTPVAAEGLVFVSDGDSLVAISQYRGQVKWRKLTGETGINPPVVDGNFTYVTTDDGVHALQTNPDVKAEFSEPYWSVRTRQDPVASPVLMDGSLFVSVERSYDSPGGIVVYTAINGNVKWRTDSMGEWGSSTAPAIADGTLFVVDGSTLRAIADGEQLAEQAITALETTIQRAKDLGMPTATAEEDLSAAETAFDRGEYRTAYDTAYDRRLKLENAISAANQAADRIDELRTALQELTAAERSSTSAPSALETAQTKYDQGEFREALEAAQSGLDAIEQYRKKRRTAKQAIQSLNDRLERMSSKGMELGPVEQLLQSARTQYDQGNYEEARATAKEGQNRLDAAKRAHESIEALSSRVKDAKSNGYELVAIQARLAAARDAFAAGDYQKARSTAKDARSTIARAKKVEKRFQQVRSKVQSMTTKKYELSSLHSKLSRAETALEAGKYEQATATLETVSGELSSAKRAIRTIEQVERDGIIERLTAPVADALGRSTKLDAARSALNNGEYNRARTLANDAASTESDAKLVVGGTGVVGTAASGLGVQKVGGFRQLRRRRARYERLEERAASIAENAGLSRDSLVAHVATHKEAIIDDPDGDVAYDLETRLDRYVELVRAVTTVEMAAQALPSTVSTAEDVPVVEDAESLLTGEAPSLDEVSEMVDDLETRAELLDALKEIYDAAPTDVEPAGEESLEERISELQRALLTDSKPVSEVRTEIEDLRD